MQELQKKLEQAVQQYANVCAVIGERQMKVSFLQAEISSVQATAKDMAAHIDSLQKQIKEYKPESEHPDEHA
jgi:peptidoglycan hydrolase CwlO-like protein